jgi:hypothetical protein
VQGGTLRKGTGQLLGVHTRDVGRVQGPAQALFEPERSPERPLQGDLLVQHHAYQQSQRVLAEQCIRLGIAGQRQLDSSHGQIMPDPGGQ